MIYYFDLISVFVCSITGALASMDKKIDGFGLFVVGAVAGIGGGTIRDITLNRASVFWIADNNYLISVVLGTVIAILFMNTLNRSYFLKVLFILDAFGLGLFTIIGADIAISMHETSIIIVIMGLITGVAGGMLRDILVNEIPLVLRKEIYATASIIGAIFYLITIRFLGPELASILAVLLIVTIRLFALKYKWHLPNFNKYRKDEK